MYIHVHVKAVHVLYNVYVHVKAVHVLYNVYVHVKAVHVLYNVYVHVKAVHVLYKVHVHVISTTWQYSKLIHVYMCICHRLLYFPRRSTRRCGVAVRTWRSSCRNSRIHWTLRRRDTLQWRYTCILCHVYASIYITYITVPLIALQARHRDEIEQIRKAGHDTLAIIVEQYKVTVSTCGCLRLCVCMYICGICVVQGLSELTVEQERDRSEEMLKELAEKEAEKTERRMEEQHTR